MAITNSDLESKLKELSRFVGIKTTAKRLGRTAKNAYSNKFLTIRGAYGKVGLSLHHAKVGQSDITHLMSKRELYNYMEAMIKGIQLKSRKS